MKKLTDYLQYLAAVSAIAVIGRMPRGVFFFLAPAISRILYLFPQMGKVAVMNLKAAFPEKNDRECRILARKSLENLFLSLCEFFWSKGRKNVVDTLIDTEEEADATAEAGHAYPVKGAIFVTPHLGNWELAGMCLALKYKFPLGTVVRTARNPYLDQLISSGRMVEGVQIIHSKGAVRAIVHQLEAERSIGILIDQNTRVRDGGAFVRFFGLPVPVSMTPAHFARRDNRFIAIGTTVRVGRKFKGILRPLPKPAGEYASDEELTQDLMNISTELIRQYPEQYLWMYKRFQYMPPDIPDDLRKRYPPYAVIPGEKFFSSRAKYAALRQNSAGQPANGK